MIGSTNSISTSIARRDPPCSSPRTRGPVLGQSRSDPDRFVGRWMAKPTLSPRGGVGSDRGERLKMKSNVVRSWFRGPYFRATSGTRTLDFSFTKAALYQLS